MGCNRLRTPVSGDTKNKQLRTPSVFDTNKQYLRTPTMLGMKARRKRVS